MMCRSSRGHSTTHAFCVATPSTSWGRDAISASTRRPAPVGGMRNVCVDP
jgi:hypothetical protein